jgi:hypothetical protein
MTLDVFGGYFMGTKDLPEPPRLPLRAPSATDSAAIRETN